MAYHQSRGRRDSYDDDYRSHYHEHTKHRVRANSRERLSTTHIVLAFVAVGTTMLAMAFPEKPRPSKSAPAALDDRPEVESPPATPIPVQHQYPRPRQIQGYAPYAQPPPPPHIQYDPRFSHRPPGYHYQQQQYPGMPRHQQPQHLLLTQTAPPTQRLLQAPPRYESTYSPRA